MVSLLLLGFGGASTVKSHNRTWYFLRDHVAKIDVPSKNLKIYRCLFIIEACLALLLAPETQTMLLVLRL